MLLHNMLTGSALSFLRPSQVADAILANGTLTHYDRLRM
jgi:hypothetical protein